MHCPTRKQELLDLYRESFRKLPRQNFEPRTAHEVSPLSGQRAAVALLFRERPDGVGLDFLLTLRSSDLQFHPGEFCLPGGMCESSDVDMRQTLERELTEELSLPAGSVEWEGNAWDAITSRWGIEAWPFVGFVKAGQEKHFTASVEVTRWEWFPLEKLFAPELWSKRILARAVSGRPLESLPVWEASKPCVWGLTAAFLSFFRYRISGEGSY